MKYTSEYSENFIKNDKKYVIRSIHPDDRNEMIHAFNLSSRTTLNNRFMAAKKNLSEEDLAFLTGPNFKNHIAIAILNDDGPVASARFYIEEDDSSIAEFAVTVIDKYQRQGFGGIILDHLIEAAKERNVRELYGTANAENDGIIALTKSRGKTIVEPYSSGIVVLRLKI